MSRILFVTGTDTGCGKTVASIALIHALRDSGKQVLAMKPVASGCEATAEGWRNADALALQAAASQPLAYPDVNPYAFAPAIAPHIAAAEAGVQIAFDAIAGQAQRLATACDVLVVEGVGGWRVPLGGGGDVADLARCLQAEVILVVGLRLGCINHTLLSAAAIESVGVRLAGWIANRIDPAMERDDENLATLDARLGVPCLGRLPHLVPGTGPATLSTHLDLSRL